MADNRTCIVTNRFGGPVSYRVPEMNVQRLFEPHETKKGIPFDELNALSMQPGGRALIRGYLFVQDEAIVNEILNTEIKQEQPEYLMSEEELVKWMPACSLPEFQDCLDYAPEGMKDLIKRYAVSLPLTDLNKINAIKEQLDFDVQEAMRMRQAELEGEETPALKSGRRVPIQAEQTSIPMRRASKYDIS